VNPPEAVLAPGRLLADRVVGPREALGRVVVGRAGAVLGPERGGRLVARVVGGLVVVRLEKDGTRGLVSGAGAGTPREGGLEAAVFVVTLVASLFVRSGRPLFEFESLRGWSASLASSASSCLRLSVIVDAGGAAETDGMDE
jgi:hypothetical protein